jgi:hypothetical protein
MMGCPRRGTVLNLRCGRRARAGGCVWLCGFCGFAGRIRETETEKRQQQRHTHVPSLDSRLSEHAKGALAVLTKFVWENMTLIL